MGKYIKKRKRQLRIKIILSLLVIVMLIVVVVVKIDNKVVESNQNNNQVQGIEKLAATAWSEAYARGKRTKEELELYIKSKLENKGIDTSVYYITASERGVTVAEKQKALLVEPGYYKANTNYAELLKSWDDLKKENIISVQNGVLMYINELEEPIDIVIDSSVTKIYDKAFYKKQNINAVAIPDSVTVLGEEVFKDSTIKEIILGMGITELDRTFENMQSLEKIQFTNSITAIFDYTFKDTKSLKEISYIGDEYSFCNTFYEGNYGIPAWYNTLKLYLNGVLIEEFVVPSGITVINDYLLYNYNNITSISIPKSVERIGIIALAKTPIKTITYDGTKKEWESIIKNESWDGDRTDYTVYCIDGIIGK